MTLNFGNYSATSKRLVDRRNLLKGAKNFVRRRHNVSPFVNILFFLSIAFLSIIWCYTWQGQLWMQAIGVVIGLVVIQLFSFKQLYYQGDIIMATEFQNALFASGLKFNNEFCLLVKKNGSLIYIDPRFVELVPSSMNGEHDGIESLLDVGGVNKDDLKHFMHSLKAGNAVQIPMQVMMPSNISETIIIHLDPINLPGVENSLASLLKNSASKNDSNQKILKDYFVIRGFKEKALLREKKDFLSHLGLGFFMLNEQGHISEANDIFLKLFHEKSKKNIIETKIMLQDFIERKSGINSVETLKKHWQGNVQLVSSSETPLRVMMNQSKSPNSTNSYGVVAALPEETLSLPDFGSNEALDIGWLCYVEESPIAEAIIAEDGTVTRCNKAFHGFFEHHEKSERNLYDIISAEDKANVQTLFDKVKSSGAGVHTTTPIEVQLQTDKSTHGLLYIDHIAKSEDQEPLLICHLIDTTEQKNLEMRMQHSQKMQAIGQLAGGIAHDFNNLLTAMIGFCDLLLIRHPTGDQSFADIMQIKQNANRAANLVRQLLAFSRKQTMQPKVINITDVLGELSNLLRRLIGENIELNIVYSRDLYPVKVDHGQLEQVIINLAVNARDAMQSGGALTIRTRNRTIDEEHPLNPIRVPVPNEEPIAPGDYVVIDIEDTGSGIAKHVLPKIFEPFFSTKKVGHGTGLGLATVYGIVKQTGGYIYVSSEENAGTTFTIYLKRHIAEEMEGKEPREIPVLQDLTGKGKILLVEDEAPVRLFGKQALTNKGYDVIEADSGLSALELLNEERDKIDIIITDVIMPGMNGPDMIKEILKDKPDLKTIFVSGYTEDAFDKDFTIDNKQFFFLPKPFSLKQLALKVKEALDG